MATDLMLLLLSVFGGVYLVLAVITLRRRTVLPHATMWLVLFLNLSAFWMFLFAARSAGWLTLIDEEAQQRLYWYIVLFLSVLFLYLNRTFLNVESSRKRWGMNWMLALVMINVFILTLLELLRPQIAEMTDSWQTIILSVVTFSWGILIARSTLITAQAYRQTRYQPLHHNRIACWLLALIFVVASSGFVFAGRLGIGAALHLPVGLLVAYALLTYRLFDVRQMVRRSIVYTAVTLLTLVLYVGGLIFGVQLLHGSINEAAPVTLNEILLVGSLVAVLISVLYNTLFSLVRKVVNRLIFGINYDHSRTLKENSQQVSQILDLHHLAEAVIGSITQTMDLRSGKLVLVYPKSDGNAHLLYQLRALDKGETMPWLLDEESPITAHFIKEKQHLTQYEIDFLPEFATVDEAEQEWFASLRAELYVPIFTQEVWTGFFALGPKRSGNRYYDSDLVLLSTLADQTAIAVQNARLVEDLRKVNIDLEAAYGDVEAANKHLQEVDELKTSFIGVISHELRTPFTSIGFSLQLLEREGLDVLSQTQKEQFSELSNAAQDAKSMVDNLVTLAAFFNKQGSLRLSQLSVEEVVNAALAPLEPLAENKEVRLDFEIKPMMPLLRGDVERLQDMVHHLIHNGIKFTNAGGHVFVNVWHDEENIYLEVRDTGIGISEELLPNLWQGFSQGADSLRRGVEGLGLGLRLVKYIANAHGGEVRVYSEVNVGSEFGVRLPIKGPSKETAATIKHATH